MTSSRLPRSLVLHSDGREWCSLRLILGHLSGSFERVSARRSERKGIWIPSARCSQKRFYVRSVVNTGHAPATSLHHNVDKAPLLGGRAIPEFRDGEVVTPINIYLAGRATSEIGAGTYSDRICVLSLRSGRLKTANLTARIDAERGPYHVQN